MGTLLSRQPPQKLQDAVALCTMSAVTGDKYRYVIKEHKTWYLKRKTSGDCTLCDDIERPCTWREVSACGHRFHRSCLRDHRKNYGAICPTCNASYLETKTKKVLVKEKETFI